MIKKIPNTFMFISIPALVTPNYLEDSLQNLYQLPISQEKESYCWRLLRRKELLIIAYDHETLADITFKIIPMTDESIKWVSEQWQTDDSLFYFARIEKCAFPLSRAVSDLIKGLEKLKVKE